MRSQSGIPKLAILTPVFNDWEAFCEFLRKVDERVSTLNFSVDVIAIDDGSDESARLDASINSLRALSEVIVISLACNLGHQRAIAVGIAHLNQTLAHDYVVIMDCDGEDCPADIAILLKASEEHGNIAVAQRTQRSESRSFRIFYALYKCVFRSLIGRNIDFGNFCAIPKAHIFRIAHMSGLWSHFAATIIRARIPLTRIPTVRGQRYAGRSKMNFVGLVTHGLSAVAVFGDQLFVRIFVAALMICAVGVLAGTVIVYIKIFTQLAIPGWATTVAGFSITILLQGVILSAIAAFLTLINRSSIAFVPAIDAIKFISGVQRIKIPCDRNMLMKGPN